MSNSAIRSDDSPWPALDYHEWQDTQATLHLWTQIVGKIRLVQTPWVNHSWHVALYVTTRGLTTSPIPYGSRTFEIEFDFVGHQLRITTIEGRIGNSGWSRTVAGLLPELLPGCARSASRSRSGRCRTKSPTPYRSTKTGRMRPTTPHRRSGSGTR